VRDTLRGVSPTLGLLLAFDGIVLGSDLPVQSFARHASQGLSAADTRALIGGMRGFLEGRPDLMPADIALDHAQDGDEAVEILARATGLDDAAIVQARRASRVDLAGSAWAVDPTPGLAELLSGLPRVYRVMVVDTDRTGVTQVAASVGIADDVDAVITRPRGSEGVRQAVEEVLDAIGPASDPKRLLAIGCRWDPDLVVPQAAGCLTGLVDRFALGRGTPTWRSADLAGLVPEVRRWATTAVPA